MEISVVIPSYNRAEKLVGAVKSVLSQTFPPAEIIVVDDGSTDDTEVKLSEIRSDLIRYVKIEKSGANAARNYGAAVAKHEWIAFQDSDDFWLPTKLETQVKYIDSQGADIAGIYGSVCEISGGAVFLRPHFKHIRTPIVRFEAGEATKRIILKNFVNTPTLMIKKKVFDDMGGFDVSLPRFQDWEFAIRLTLEWNTLFLNSPHVWSEKGNDSITKDFYAGIFSRSYILNKHSEIFDSHLYSKILFKMQILIRKCYGFIKNMR